ncbi:hypothetical protein CABS01_09767 [Colletotrichum abscissum]|uniref:Uncharacterized protein n=1 Tax=Colletotrichum abscissum TaxID=1671311 RepID=A0A9Q0B894_9PEZI|nr:uncharacterized protein CABS01_09767 [Colletotrichum abscissum]KAI3556833.1 hypothetical protein CABS02_02840 [Colletotrichum abscissum]KAK1501032.1 hypothetical protein CABS01_09767 [Colletotrichum abscissum]
MSRSPLSGTLRPANHKTQQSCRHRTKVPTNTLAISPNLRCTWPCWSPSASTKREIADPNRLGAATTNPKVAPCRHLHESQSRVCGLHSRQGSPRRTGLTRKNSRRRNLSLKLQIPR